MSDQLAQALKNAICEWDAHRYQAKFGHRPKHIGWSGIGSCIGKQVMESRYYKKEASGHTIRGIFFEEMMKTVFPIGKVIDNTYRVEAHNVIVEMEILQFQFESEIDIVVQNLQTGQREVWDWKNTYINNVVDEGTDENIMQVNLSAYKYGCKTFRLIYGDSIDWLRIVPQSYQTEEKLAQETIERLVYREILKLKTEEELIAKWSDYAEGLDMIRYTPKRHNEKRPCDYCKIRSLCEKWVGAKP